MGPANHLEEARAESKGSRFNREEADRSLRDEVQEELDKDLFRAVDVVIYTTYTYRVQVGQFDRNAFLLLFFFSIFKF
jgi:hypothetical protein